MISIYDNDNDNHTSINTFVKTFSEKFACIINDVAKSDEVKNFMQSFITFLEDIASGKIQPDKDFIQGMIEIYRNNPADVPESIRGYVKELAENDTRPVIKATTRKAKSALVEVSKAGRKLHDKSELPAIYNGGIFFPTGKTRSKNPKPIDTVLSLTFEELDDWKGFLPKNKRITPFTLEVLTHLMTLKAAGNEYTSTKILFRQMNGGADKEPTKAFRDAVYDALCILGCTRIKIDATEEHEAGYNERRFYEGALLANSIKGREIITLNGSFIEDAIHILGQSPLFEYALAKGQIQPIPIEMYNITITDKDKDKKRTLTSTEENIVLIGYMIRTYADMINEHSDRDKHIIAYDTIYDYLGVEGKSQYVINNKKAKIRATVKEILTAWQKMGFVKKFYELTADNNPATQGKKVAKVWVDFTSTKELEETRKKELENALESGNILPPT